MDGETIIDTMICCWLAIASLHALLCRALLDQLREMLSGKTRNMTMAAAAAALTVLPLPRDGDNNGSSGRPPKCVKFLVAGTLVAFPDADAATCATPSIATQHCRPCCHYALIG